MFFSFFLLLLCFPLIALNLCIQAECEELAKRVETLKEENSSLRDELEHMREESQKLAAENATLTVSSDLCILL